MNRREFIRTCALLYGSGALAALSGCSSEAPAIGATGAADPQAPDGFGSALPPSDPLVHLLKRTRLGVSADDLAQAQTQGAAAYLEAQLTPGLLPDAAELDAALRFPLTQLPLLLLYRLSDTDLLQATQQLAEKSVFLGIYSDRQLFEVLVDFWNDHFNIENVTGTLPAAKIDFDRSVIRAHALGRFSALLHATAKSPAMLEYLDGAGSRAEGPNENYARELLELHTLGHGGGYSETDIREVARCFTGWSFNAITGAFQFRAQDHDDGDKLVLGLHIPAGGGVTDGERVLDLLAAHPSTARFIATKLVRRLVADDPEPTLVALLAAEFERTQGDIPALLRLLFTQPEFYRHSDAKFRRPLDLVCAAIRAFDNAPLHYPGSSLITLLNRLGHVPHGWFPPDGYPDSASHWLSANGLLERWNFAALLGESRDTRGRSLAATHVREQETPASLVDRLAARLLLRPLRAVDRDRLIALAGDPAAVLSGDALALAAERIAGLMLASPAFNLR